MNIITRIRALEPDSIWAIELGAIAAGLIILAIAVAQNPEALRLWG